MTKGALFRVKRPNIRVFVSLLSMLGVFGSVPQSLVDDEEDFIGHLDSSVSDLVGDCRVAPC